MLDRYDQLELLALIEGELDPRAEACIRANLAGDPQAAAMVDRLRQDRQSLRTLEQPELPMDFLARLEPVMARPMLMEPMEATGAMRVDPAHLRRQHSRKGRRIRWGRLTAVAALFFGAIGLGILVFTQWPKLTRPTNDQSMVAIDDREPQRSAVVETPTARRNWSAADGTIHHAGPVPTISMSMASRSTVSSETTRVASAPGVTVQRTVVAEFALVLQSRDHASAEQAVQRAAARLGDTGALVRNFSYDEARELSDQWRIAHGGGGAAGGSRDPMMVSAAPGSNVSESVRTPAQFAELAQHVREQLGTKAPGSAGSVTSGPLAGRGELGPSLEQQLDLSSRGARYTLAVPASQVAGLIEQISLVEGQSATLRLMKSAASFPFSESGSPDAPKQPSAQPLDYWLSEGPLVRRAVASLAQARENVLVLVPVMVADDADPR